MQEYESGRWWNSVSYVYQRLERHSMKQMIKERNLLLYRDSGNNIMFYFYYLFFSLIIPHRLHLIQSKYWNHSHDRASSGTDQRQRKLNNRLKKQQHQKILTKPCYKTIQTTHFWINLFLNKEWCMLYSIKILVSWSNALHLCRTIRQEKKNRVLNK